MTTDPVTPRDALIDAGRRRLLTHGIDALRSQLNASILSREAALSRDTAYRVFRNDRPDGKVSDAIVTAVAEAVHDGEWSGIEAAMDEAAAAYRAEVDRDDDPEAPLVALLQANFEAQFAHPGLAAWVLQTAAATGSQAWNGDPPAEGNADLARRILEARRANYCAITDSFLRLLTVAMSDVGRRPRRDVDSRSLVVLLHCLLDGAVLRRLVEPEAVTPALIAKAMYRLGLAMTEPGPLADPRRPQDESGQEIFDRVIVAATRCWQTQSEVLIADVAQATTVPVEAVGLLFPSIGDMADSVVRAHVVSGGFIYPGAAPDARAARQLLPGVVAQLRRLRDLADRLPHALAATRDHSPTRSKPFVDDCIDSQAIIIETLDVTAAPGQLLRDLVGFASLGTPGWSSVSALLRAIGYDTSQEDG